MEDGRTANLLVYLSTGTSKVASEVRRQMCFQKELKYFETELEIVNFNNIVLAPLSTCSILTNTF